MKKSLYIFFPALLAFGFLIWLSSCARLSYDDFLFAACFKTRSFSGVVEYLNSSHAFRWTTFLFEYLVLGAVPATYYPVSIPLFFFLLYTCWIYGLHVLITRVLKNYFNTTISLAQSLGLASMSIFVFYFSASQAVESFTSVIVVTDRLLPLVFFTFAVNFFLSGKTGVKILLQLAILALLIAGTAENISASLLMLLCLLMAAQKLIFRKNPETKLFFFTTALLFFFLFEAFSKGNEARYIAEKTYHFSCGTDGVYCANNFSDFLKKYFNGRQVFLFAFVLPFFVFAAGLPAETKKTCSKKLNMPILFTALFCIPVALFHFISAFKIFECYGPMRMWLPLNIVTAVLLILLSLKTGLNTRWESIKMRIPIDLLVSVLILFYFTKHFSETNAYVKAYDARASYLLNLKTNDSTVTVPSLPPAGLVVHGDIMEDENDDVNRDFKDTYCLPFRVKKK